MDCAMNVEIVTEFFVASLLQSYLTCEIVWDEYFVFKLQEIVKLNQSIIVCRNF